MMMRRRRQDKFKPEVFFEQEEIHLYAFQREEWVETNDVQAKIHHRFAFDLD